MHRVQDLSLGGEKHFLDINKDFFFRFETESLYTAPFVLELTLEQTGL